MTFDQLQTFRTVAAVKSFGRAADLLHITQPAISKQIRALETELDERLFERGRSAQLTVAGMALLRHVEGLSRMLTAARQEIADLKELRGGHLSIGATHSIATYVLPDLIESYRTKYPKVNLSIESGWSAAITRRLMTYDLDLGLVLIVAPEMKGLPQLTFIPLASMDLVFVTSSTNPLAKRDIVTWDDLKRAPWILNQEGCQFRAYIEQRLKERGETMKVEVEIIGFELQKRLTQLGLGISLLPKSFVTTEFQQGSLKALNIKGTKLHGYSCLVFRKDKYIHGAMKGFLRLLQEIFHPAKNGLRKYIGSP
jgi:LysR family transcriptional regulator, transcriptional activator of the cysJI operon